MDISKRICDREGKFVFEMKEGNKVSCVKILVLLNYWEVGIYLKYSTPHTLLKILKNVLILKSGCF